MSEEALQFCFLGCHKLAQACKSSTLHKILRKTDLKEEYEGSG